MPGFDRTGPLGHGALTGRKRGRCQGNQAVNTKTIDEPLEEKKEVFYGLGRGGRPRSGGVLGNRRGNVQGKDNGRGRRRGLADR
ncbi:MAG: DUF5320 domain-containing protein [Ignavibacteriaceae bacterium]